MSRLYIEGDKDGLPYNSDDDDDDGDDYDNNDDCCYLNY